MVGGAGGAGGAVGGAVAWQLANVKNTTSKRIQWLQVTSRGYARSIYGGDAGLGTSIKRL